jgi:hypothetical protein
MNEWDTHKRLLETTERPSPSAAESGSNRERSTIGWTP